MSYPPGAASHPIAVELMTKLDAGQSVVAPPGFVLIVIAPAIGNAPAQSSETADDQLKIIEAWAKSKGISVVGEVADRAPTTKSK